MVSVAKWRSTLALLMARISANNTHHTFAAYYFAITANFLDRSGNFHFFS
jgi:hypothetical protein